MPSSSRTLPYIGIALVLALLLSARASAPTRAFAQSRAASAMSNTLGPVHFIWTTPRSLIRRDCTTITSRFTDYQPQAVLFVTPYWANDPHPIFVQYVASEFWQICHADQSPIPALARFNVLVVPQENTTTVFFDSGNFEHESISETVIDTPLTDGNPSAQILITQNLTPGGHPLANSTLDTGNLGVWYDYSLSSWAIINENALYWVPQGASFNVMIGADASGGGSESLLTATDANTSSNTVSFANPLTTDNGNALLFVTQNWNPKAALNDNAIGVSYGCIIGIWCVYNQQVTQNMPLGAAFNILVFSS